MGPYKTKKIHYGKVNHHTEEIQATKWGENFINYTSNREQIYKIYKQQEKWNIVNISNTFKNGVQN